MTNDQQPYWAQPIRPYATNPTYSEQRRERLRAAIDDYMCTDDFDPRQCFEEIIAEVINSRDYHNNQRDKANTLLTMLMGPKLETL